MLDSLKNYLEQQGIHNIFLDFMPPAERALNVVNLAEWQNVVPSLNDGSSTHYIQVQVRRDSYDKAKADCKVIFKLLDSGTDERLIWLNDDICCIGRPRRGAILLERGDGYATFYCEIAIWANTN